MLSSLSEKLLTPYFSPDSEFIEEAVRTDFVEFFLLLDVKTARYILRAFDLSQKPFLLQFYNHKQLKRNHLIFSPSQIVFVFYQIYMMRFSHINAMLSVIILFSNIMVILKVKFASGTEAKTSQRCEKCKIVKSKSQTHCKYCDVCVEEFDHCKFLGACICKNNYFWFICVIICCLMQEFAFLLRKGQNGVVLHVLIYVYVQIIILIHLLK
ncbi:Zinc_finger domain-containing protein [Hexamita inflata]|uniref:Palmitoyltransferase n=1 Tax=Hexamita inflata TaxID=28002 RepID=A0AA86URT6_9EUKA|nr:Zinc finger domain-containing protein [Hexamita inflata]